MNRLAARPSRHSRPSNRPRAWPLAGSAGVRTKIPGILPGLTAVLGLAATRQVRTVTERMRLHLAGDHAVTLDDTATQQRRCTARKALAERVPPA